MLGQGVCGQFALGQPDDSASVPFVPPVVGVANFTVAPNALAAFDVAPSAEADVYLAPSAEVNFCWAPRAIVFAEIM